MKKYYTGIGSRETPKDVLNFMEKLSYYFDKKGYTLRSGGAVGADKAFEKHATNPEIYKIGNICVPLWAFREVQKHLPPNRNWATFKSYTKKLLARNMLQVLGRDGIKPSEFVVCWTYDGADSGGTGYAIRCAYAHDITLYNLNDTDDVQHLYNNFTDLYEFI